MGNKQGKIKNSREEILHNDKKIKCDTFSLFNKNKSVYTKENIFSVICYHIYEECIFQLIEFHQDVTLKSIDSQFGIFNLAFKEFSTTKRIFEGILKTFKATNIKLPSNIYVCILNRMWNIFFKFNEKFEEEIYKIKKNHTEIIKTLEKNLPIENDFEYQFISSSVNSIIDVEENFSVGKGKKSNLQENLGKNFDPLIQNNNPKIVLESLTEEDATKFSKNFKNLKIIPNLHQNLLGFFYEKFDYITDIEFSSFYLIGLNSNLNDYDIYKEIEIVKGHRIKEIIRNPFEEESIARVIIYKDNQNSFENSSSTKISIKEFPLMILPIPFQEKINPEDLYTNFQVHVMSREEIKNKNFLLKILEKSFGEILEINFLTLTHAVITFFDINSVDICLDKNQMVFYDEKEVTEDESVIIEKFIDRENESQALKDSLLIVLAFSLNLYPSAITGEKINLEFVYENKFTHKSLPIRPPKPYLFRNTYIPSINYLIRNNNMWCCFKLENEFSNFVSVEELLNNFLSNLYKSPCLTANSPNTNTNTYLSNAENPRENEEYVLIKNRNLKVDRKNLKKENRNLNRNFSSDIFYARQKNLDSKGKTRQNKFSDKNKKCSMNRNDNEKYFDPKFSDKNQNDKDDLESEKDIPDNLTIYAIDKKDEINSSNFLDISELNQIFSQSESSFSKKNNEKEINIREYQDLNEIPSPTGLLNSSYSHTKNLDQFPDEFEQLLSDGQNVKKKPIKYKNEFLNLIPTNFLNSNKILDEMVDEIKKGYEKKKPKILFEISKSSGEKENNKIRKLITNKIQKKQTLTKNYFKSKNYFPIYKRKEFLKKKRKSCPELIDISDDSSTQDKKQKFDDIDIIIIDEEDYQSNSFHTQEIDLEQTLSDLDREKTDEIIIELHNLSE